MDARHWGRFESWSTINDSSNPYPIPTPIKTAIAAMAELGYDLSAHDSKSLDNVKDYAPFDAVVTMGTYRPWFLSSLVFLS